MKAVRIREFGTEHLVVEELPRPQPGPGEVLLRMKAAALNFRDLLMVRGLYNPKQPLPLIPCSDGVGLVEDCGAGVTEWKPGERVLPCFAPDWLAGEPEREALRTTLGGPRDGTLAEWMVLPAHGLVRAPARLSDTAAATLGCAGLTAWSALVTLGGLRAGETVLVQGTGGVSLYALQLAKLHGARVIATSSSDEKLERALALGADHGINYRRDPRWGQTARDLTGGRGVDHVVEVGGAGTLEQSLRAVRAGGQVHVIGVLSGVAATVGILPILMNQVRVEGVLVGHREGLRALCRALEASELQPVIDRTFALSEAPAAFEHLASGQHFGKIALQIA